MLKFLQNLFDDNARDIKKYNAVVEKINAFEPQISALSDEALQAKTAEFKARLQKGETENTERLEIFPGG
ncbi:MAG: hypothetical protein IJP33_02070, partial [Firmicutes bacterium]|nr:hypothetical protein [Bacillota bacterium]